MAQSLSTIRNELDRIKAAADSAQADVARLKQELIDVLNLRAKGGTPLPARVGEVANQILAGQQVAARTRLGGGARLSPQHPYPAYTTEQYTGGLLARYNRAQEELAYNKLKEAQLSKIEADVLAKQAAEESKVNQQILTNLKNKAAAIEKQVQIEQQKAAQSAKTAVPPEIALRRQFYGATAPTGGQGTPVRDPETGKVYVGDKVIYDPGPGYASFRKEYMGDEDLVDAARAPRGKQAAPKVNMSELEAALGGKTDLNRLIEKAQSFGFGAGGTNIEDQIKKVRLFGENYKQVIFEMTQGDRIAKELTLTMDKHGNIMESTQKAYRTFLGSIQRNTAEMIKWSAAALLVWGTIRKLQDLVAIAIKNETSLANIAVILGKSHADLSRIFEDAAEAANAAGESIDGVLEGYAQAYQATGNIADANERARVTQQLLTDSLILSKISSLNQAEAMDTLTGALRQAGLSLDNGRVLLDSWVAVSRKANVGLDTLATSFAITATTAENAGISFHQLNGIIATLAESTVLGAKETGNAIRAFISGFTTDTAVKELSQFGIAVNDINGEARPFLDVMSQIASLSQKGIISEQQLNLISRAIGGGARREAQVATTIKNLGRAQELAAVSAGAHGDAENALSIQLDTVQTSITRLNNSVQVLARTLGSEGGVLGIVGNLTNGLGGLVEMISALIKNLGDLTPVLAGIAALMITTSDVTRNRMLVDLVAGGGARLASSLNRGLITKITGGKQFEGDVLSGNFLNLMGKQFYKPMIGGPATVGGVLGGAAFTGYSVFKDIKQQDWAGVGGSIAGGLSGFLIAGPLGSVLGTSIGEAFANATFGYKPEFENFFKEVFKKPTDETPVGAAGTQEDVINQIFASYGRGSTGYGKYRASINAWFANTIAKVKGIQGQVTPEQMAFNFAPADLQKQLQAIKQASEAQKGLGVTPGQFNFSFINKQADVAKQYGIILDEIQKKQADTFRGQGLKGLISDKDLRDALEQIPNLSSAITSYEVAFGNAFRKVNTNIKEGEQSFQEFAKVILGSSPEQLQYVNALVNEIARITNAMDAAKAAGQDTFLFKPDDPTVKGNQEVFITIEEGLAKIKELGDNAALSFTNMSKSLSISTIKLPSITTLDIKPQDIKKVLDRAAQLQSTYISQTFKEGLNAGLTEADIRGTFEPIMVQAGEDGGYYYAEGFMSQFISNAVEQMKAAGEILGPASKMGLQQLDIPSTQFPQVFARYQQLVSSIQGQLATQGVEWKPNEETFAGLFTDFIAQPITADLTLLNIAMQELIDVNKKELDGIYNLPTDASFYVPFTGYQMGFVNRGGGGGGGGGFPAAPPADQTVVLANAAEKVLSQMTGSFGLEGVGKMAGMGTKILTPGGLTPTDFGLGKGPLGPNPLTLEEIMRRKSEDMFPANMEDLASKLSTTINLESTTTVTLVVDGQTLANVVKPYFLSDTLRYEGAGGGVTKRYVM